MELDFDEALKEFGLPDGLEEPRPKYYEFKSLITGKQVSIELLEDDIIVDGELKRIIRDDTGEIPDWAKPINSHNDDYVRLSPSGNYYTKTGKQGKLYNQKISIHHRGEVIGRKIRRMLVYTFLEHNTEDTRIVFIDQKDKNFDITNIEYKINKEIIPVIEDKSDISEIDTIGAKKYHDVSRRCTEQYQLRHRAYIGCSLSEEWKNPKNFKSWFRDSVYMTKSIKEEISKLQVEKDIMVKGNKIYGPNTCLLVPLYINNYFIHKNNKLGLPGVKEVNLKNGGVKYVANICDFMRGKGRTIDTFYTPEAAHREYLKEKNRQLQELVLPYFIEDVEPEYKNHPMVLKVIDTLRNATIS